MFIALLLSYTQKEVSVNGYLTLTHVVSKPFANLRNKFNYTVFFSEFAILFRTLYNSMTLKTNSCMFIRCKKTYFGDKCSTSSIFFLAKSNGNVETH